MFNQNAFNQGIYTGIGSPATSISVVTAVCKAQEGLPFPKFLAGGVGGQGGNNYKLFKKADSYSLNIWRSQLFTFDSPFTVQKIELAFSTNINENHIIIPTLYLDNGGSSVLGTTIDSTNYPDGENSITLTPANFSYNTHGQNNFFLELRFTGTGLNAVTLPITIEVETDER